jgi:hypothetical protein
MPGFGHLRAAGHAADPLAKDAALRRSAAIFPGPVPHGSVLRDSPGLFSPIGAVRRQPGFGDPDLHGLLNRQVAIEDARNATARSPVPSQLSHGQISFRLSTILHSSTGRTSDDPPLDAG